MIMVRVNGAGGQEYAEAGAQAGSGDELDAAAVRGHDRRHDRQSQAGSVV
jgi:hypothetical protein